MTSVVILGAGKPTEDVEVSSLILIDGDRTTLDYLAGVFSVIKDAHVQFVGGYHFEKILAAYPDLPFVLNDRWDSSGSLGSFLLADVDLTSSCFVTYSDVVYSKSLVLAMLESSADVVIACDSDWRCRYGRRSEEDLGSAEKVYFTDGTFQRISTEEEIYSEVSEFCGLVSFSCDVVAYIEDHREILLERFFGQPLYVLINHLIQQGFELDHVDAKESWAELNAPADLGQFVLGTKAETLDRLQLLIKQGLVSDCLYFSFEDWLNRPRNILEHIQLFSEQSKLIVRSSARSEDQSGQSNAGKFESMLNIDAEDREMLRGAVQSVFKSYGEPQSTDQILIQHMIQDVRLAGVIVTRTLDYGAPYFVINYELSSSTDAVTSGRGLNLRTLVVARNADIEQLDCDASIIKLLSAVKEIEGVLSDDSLDIEFAITNSGEVHILQVRPIVAKAGFRSTNDGQVFGAMEEVLSYFSELQHCPPHLHGDRTILGRMPDWNPAEIVGTRPNQLAKSLYEYLILDDIWSRQRAEYGYRDVRPSRLLKTLHGNAFVDVRASFNSFVPSDLSEDKASRLIDFYLSRLERAPESHDKVEFDILFTCYDFDLRERMEILGDEALFSEREIASIYDQLVKITKRQFPLSAMYIAKAEVLDGEIKAILDTKTAIIDKVALLLHKTKEFGTLPFAHLARNGFVATSLLRSLVRKEVISRNDLDRFYKSLSTITYQMELDSYLMAKGDMSSERYLDKYGHLRPGTYEISVPTYAQDLALYFPADTYAEKGPPEALLEKCWTDENIVAITNILEASPMNWNFSEFDKFLRDAIAGREYAKFLFSKGLSKALDLIARWGQSAGLSLSELSHLKIHDVLDAPSGRPLSAAGTYGRNISKEKEKIEVAKLLEFPNLITKPEDIRFHSRERDQGNFVTASSILGRVKVVSRDNFDAGDLAGAIVLIEQADPGFDWLFSRGIGGLITLYGGANSHMTIRCSELGIPAAIGTGETIFRKLMTANKLLLDCGNQKIEILN